MGVRESAQRIIERVSEQADLIEQIKTALAEKAAGGVELPVLENPGSASDLARGKQLIGADGSVVDGGVQTVNDYMFSTIENNNQMFDDGDGFGITHTFTENTLFREGSEFTPCVEYGRFGNATEDDVRQGKTFTSAAGVLKEGKAILPGGGFVYPDGAFAPVKSFTAGKQYALVSMIGGVRRYINTTAYNSNTLNATEITIAEDAGDYVIFSTTPALFTAVASGDGFLLQNGSNYLHGKPSPGAVLSLNTTQAVWMVDTSATAGLDEGKYLPKEDPNAVWLFNYNEGYNWTIKFETANNSFGYDRNGRDSSNSTNYVSFVLYEYVAGEGNVNVPTGGSSGSVIKTGTTTSGTIATGLSEIEEFFLYKESVTATGLIHLHYSKTNGTSYLHASAWSTQSFGTKTIANGTTAATVSGGSITIPGTSATTGGLSSGVTYKWTAVGK